MTMYKYLKKTYGKKVVKGLFNELGLDKSRPIPIEWQRAQGNTTFAGLVVVLEKYVKGREFTVFSYIAHNIDEVKLEDRLELEDVKTYQYTIELIEAALQNVLLRQELKSVTV